MALPAITTAQPPTVPTAYKWIANSSNNISGRAITATADGGAAFTTIINEIQFQWRVVVTKQNAMGEEQWTATYALGSSAWASAIRQTPDGGFVVVGTMETGDFVLSGEIFVLRISATGEAMWAKAYRANLGYLAGAADVALRPNGGFAITGTISPDKIVVNDNPSWEGLSSGFALLTDSSGNIDAQRQYQLTRVSGTGSQTMEINGGATILALPNGGYAIAGTAYITVIGTREAYLMFINEEGQTTGGQFYSANGQQDVTSLIASNDGGFVIGGTSERDIGAGEVTTDMFALAVTETGIPNWLTIYSMPGDDRANAILPTPDGGYMLVGQGTVANNEVEVTWDLTMVKIGGDGSLDWGLMHDPSPGGLDWSSRGMDATIPNDGGYMMIGDAEPGASADTYTAFIVKTDELGRAGECNESPVTPLVLSLQIGSTDIGTIDAGPELASYDMETTGEVQQIEYLVLCSISGVEDPTALHLGRAYPNPVRAGGLIRLGLQGTPGETATVEFYTTAGELAAAHSNLRVESDGGSQSVIVVAPSLSAGRYTARITSRTSTATVAVIVIE